MSVAIGGLMAGFLLLGGLLLVLLIRTGLAPAFKLSAIAAVTLFYWVQFEALQRYAGWPASGPLPDEFVLLASEVVEPDRSRGEPGRMYWWVRESGDPTIAPRVYELPYAKQVHQQSAEVLAQQEQGSQFIGRQTGSLHASDNLGIEFEKADKPAGYRKY